MQRWFVERASKAAAAGLLTWAVLGTVHTARLHAETPPVAPPAAEATAAAEPTAPAAAGTSGAAAKVATGRDLNDTLTGDGRFATLTQALRTAGMVNLLKSKGPYTFFAPTDEAWKKLPSATLEGLLAQPSQLKAVLAYHIIRGRVDNVGLHKLRNALTMGGIVDIDYVSGVKINSAVVTGADLLCRNGIVHAIDKVLLPSERKRPGLAKATAARKSSRSRVPAASGPPPAP